MSDTQNFSFGYIPDVADPRDYRFSVSLQSNIQPIDLSAEFPPIRNQGNIGSCTAFAATAMFEYVRKKQRLYPWSASPLFTYYATRKITNRVDQDNGAAARDALKSVVNFGATKEECWPYDVTQFTINPPVSAWEDAEKHQALVYYSIDQTRFNLLGCLADGYPFMFGAKLYQSFIDTQTTFMVHNYLPMPDTSKEQHVGNHCMLAVGFTEYNGSTYVKVRNSWGNSVGLGGYHNMPIEYLLNPSLCMDFWTIRLTESSPDEEIPLPPEPPKPAPVTPVEPPVPTPEPPKPIMIDPTPPPDFVVETNMWKKPVTYFFIVFVILVIIMMTL